MGTIDRRSRIGIGLMGIAVLFFFLMLVPYAGILSMILVALYFIGLYLVVNPQSKREQEREEFRQWKREKS